MRKLLLLGALAALATSAHAMTTGPTQHGTAAYPPSCLAWPIFNDQPSGPTYSRSTTLPVVDRATLQPVGFEPVDFTFWRVRCDGGRSAMMLRIARAANVDRINRAVQFPSVPGLAARQGSFSGMVRLAQEPNAQDSSLAPGALIPYGVTLVLEHFYRNDGTGGGALKPDVSQSYLDPYFDFNQALDITVPAPAGILAPPPPPLSIPAYDPSAYTASPLPVTGYNAGTYYDAAHSGEGIIVDVMGGLVGDFMLPQRALTLAWFTYDRDGRPFWLFGTKIFLPGAKTVEVPMIYLANGSFAGGSSAQATRSAWGTVTVGFPNCGSISLRYAANANLPAPVPGGSGERVWSRLTEQNGLSCR